MLWHWIKGRYCISLWKTEQNILLSFKFWRHTLKILCAQSTITSIKVFHTFCCSWSFVTVDGIPTFETFMSAALPLSIALEHSSRVLIRLTLINTDYQRILSSSFSKSSLVFKKCPSIITANISIYLKCFLLKALNAGTIKSFFCFL